MCDKNVWIGQWSRKECQEWLVLLRALSGLVEYASMHTMDNYIYIAMKDMHV